MFTSRAEYRLMLREDNADLRLTEIGRSLGLVDDLRWRRFEAKREAVEQEQQRLRDCWVRPGTPLSAEVEARTGEQIKREVRALDLLSRPAVDYADLVACSEIGNPLASASTADASAVAEQVQIQATYGGYLARQRDEIERQRNQEARALPSDFDYEQVRGLSAEVSEKLRRVRPVTVGQAARIPGMTPAAVSLLLIHLKRLSA
jgi:tRNA uridine 5-carboxymethylaminomethyl modification enzyme